MTNKTIVVIGASSGGIEAIGEVLSGLPRNLLAAVFVVQHVAASSIGYLPKMLAAKTKLHVASASDGGIIEAGGVYVARPDRHLLVDADQMFLSRGPRENRVRPAIDPLFRSAALFHGQRVIGVILSGSLDDGTSGLLAIKKRGGVAIVQDPATALTPDMPQSAIDYVDVDHCLKSTEIGPLIERLAIQSRRCELTSSINDSSTELLGKEVGIVKNESGNLSTATKLGELVAASCPECGGPLWEIDDEVPRYRCHTGHAFTARHLVSGLQEAEEQSLWVALRVMEERVRMLRRLAAKDHKFANAQSGKAFAERADESEEHVRRIRAMLSS